MKGIVMEIHKDKVIVLAKDGSFLEVNRGNRTLDIGQEIMIDTNKKLRRQIIRRFVSVAAAFILLLTTGYGVYGYYTPYGYINVDINPSVEIAYNLYNRVIDLKGLNEDGNILISKIKDYRNKPIENVINEVIDTAVEEAYVKPEEENVILITITEKKDKVDDKKIYKSVDSHIKQKVKNTQVVLIEGDTKVYKKASEDKVSPGKLMLIKEAIDLNKDIKFEEVAKKPVKEIMKIIKEAKKEKEKDEEERKKLEKKAEKEMRKTEELKIEKKERMRFIKDKLYMKIRKDKKEKKEDKIERKEVEKDRKDEIKKEEEEKEIEKDKIKEYIEKDQNKYFEKKTQEKLKERRREKEGNLMVDDNAKDQDDENKDTDDKLEEKNKSKHRYENKYKHDKKEQDKDKEEDKDKDEEKDKDED
ncbi:anti-sigma factor domain-containing protein [Caloranaerobacter ferrireducens]|uniref:anti-sigma factor domain-containing protein n=1 Tax=Caloranaerobacter ferrireducens TaxID=1323370 RepID=UPI00084DCB23|nr:anti-sigma factor domain-containing protein [Caloranaerobacter ferrireducens]